MRIPLILLLISLLTGGLYSQAPQPNPSQQPNTVNIRPRTSAQPPGIPEVKAVADRNRVPVGEPVTFTLSPASVIEDQCFRVTLFFGDGSRQVAKQARIVYPYPASGNFTYSILVQPTGKCTAKPTATPTPTPLADIPNVSLIVTPPTVDVNQSVTFVAELSRIVQNYSYRFVFGDGSETGWQNDPKTSHVYREPNTYQPYVDIGYTVNRIIKQVGGSKRQTITVSGNQNGNTNTNGNQNDNRPNNNNGSKPNNNQSNSTNGNTNTVGNLNANTSDNRNTRANGNANAAPRASATVTVSSSANQTRSRDDWWPYPVFLLLLLLAGYKAVTYFLVPRPTFVPNPDVGNAKASGFGFDFQVDVDPNVDGAFKIDTAGGSLIKETRKQ